jgi:ATP-dependent DNA helicase PIF1
LSKFILNEKQIDLSDVTLSPDQEEILSVLQASKTPIFLTGKAGTGKSLLLQYFRQKSEKNIVVCAPTGVAALNIGGQTIHSLFKIPPGIN